MNYSKAMLSFSGKPSEIASNSWSQFSKYLLYIKRYPEYEEYYLRQILKELLNCFWYYKNARVGISILMHNIGKYLRINYGCLVHSNIGYHSTQCPNILLHNDFGFSIRSTEKYICSICFLDPLDCIHRTNKKYDNVKCMKYEELCNVCRHNIKECEHIIGNNYNQVLAQHIVKEMNIITWDLVSEPEEVFTRIYEQPLYPDKIYEEYLGDTEKLFYGNVPLDCDHCLSCKKYDPDKNKIFKNVCS